MAEFRTLESVGRESSKKALDPNATVLKIEFLCDRNATKLPDAPTS